MSGRCKFLSTREMADLIPDGATLAVTGSGGGLMEPDEILKAIEARFKATGHPRDLTVFHTFGLGDGQDKGMNRLAHEGLVKCVIGGHWSWSPRMQELAETNQISAYALPTGVMGLLLRETGAGRPGLITKTGLGTFVDPEHGGGRLNEAAIATLVERLEIDGETYLRYKPIPIDFAIVRGTSVDRLGNITAREEPADLDVFSMCLAAHNSGGSVFVQTRDQLDVIPARSVTLPRALVSAVAIVPIQEQTYLGGYRTDFAGAAPAQIKPSQAPTGIRAVIARRAALEMPEQGVVNLGFGISASVTCFTDVDPATLTVCAEQGIYDGVMETGPLFGISSCPTAIIPATSQFDFYSGGGLDATFLGMAEMDGAGNVNVSHLGARPVGPGGFIDISQNARKVVFCGTFDAKGSDIEVVSGGLQIHKHGAVKKLVENVRAITFSGAQALAAGAEVFYVTERAVFRLTADGVELCEVAKGLDIERDVLSRMGFAPIVREVRQMPTSVFE